MTQSQFLNPNLIARLRPNSWLANVCQSIGCERPHSTNNPYIGRFAPSPSGQLHQGSLIAALASYLHAHWNSGTWLVRMEDVDTNRCKREYGDHQIQTLRQLGFVFDEPVWQSARDAIYQAEFDRLHQLGTIYPCTCTRRDIGDGVYQGTCRNGHAADKPIRSWRFRLDDDVIKWHDENGTQHHDQPARSVGDFVIKRLIDENRHEWTYQFAVVIDDADRRITHIVRGADLTDSTARQIALQRALGYPTPVYNHFPLLTNEQGDKLSKSGQAPALDVLEGLAALQHAWRFLGGWPIQVKDVNAFWAAVGVKQKP